MRHTHAIDTARKDPAYVKALDALTLWEERFFMAQRLFIQSQGEMTVTECVKLAYDWVADINKELPRPVHPGELLLRLRVARKGSKKKAVKR
jgi:hypothetical protein